MQYFLWMVTLFFFKDLVQSEIFWKFCHLFNLLSLYDCFLSAENIILYMLIFWRVLVTQKRCHLYFGHKTIEKSMSANTL